VNWLDHVTWKSIADFASDGKTIAGAVIALMGWLATVLGWFAGPLRWVRSKFQRAGKGATNDRPLRFVTDDSQALWSLATSKTNAGSQEGTHLHGIWHVTNISDRNVVILKARLEGHQTDFAHVSTQAPDENVFGSKNPILANTMSEVSADFTFFPGIGNRREPLTLDVIFTDNFGDEHRVRAVRFRYVGP
jgi:hypothetical protein